jgi:hypothetical protein
LPVFLKRRSSSSSLSVVSLKVKIFFPAKLKIFGLGAKEIGWVAEKKY